jgi:hypothetical protein
MARIEPYAKIIRIFYEIKCGSRILLICETRLRFATSEKKCAANEWVTSQETEQSAGR